MRLFKHQNLQSGQDYLQRGFTLIELVVTGTFISVAFAAIIGVFIAVNNLNRQARNLTLATEAAQNQMEDYRNRDFANLVNGIYTFTPDSTGKLINSIGVAELGDVTLVTHDTIRTLRVTVEWDEAKAGGVRKKVEVRTLISSTGINK